MGRVGSLGSLVFAICIMPVLAHAQPMRPDAAYAGDLCQRAIAASTPAVHLPVGLLGAIGRVESGRRDPRDGSFKAWPWSVNAEGRGYAFNSKAEAIAAVLAMQARNVASVDVGCMQVNLMYHPAAFASLDEAFDPAVNVRYAMKFLGQLFAETKDWNLAAAFYHSKTPDRALAYQQKVLAQLPGAARAQVVSTEQVSLVNAWSATLGAAPSAPASPTFAMQDTVRPSRLARSRPQMFASRR